MILETCGTTYESRATKENSVWDLNETVNIGCHAINRLVLLERYVAGDQHAVITGSRMTALSRNTWLNGIRCLPATLYEIDYEDIVSFGSVSFIIRKRYNGDVVRKRVLPKMKSIDLEYYVNLSPADFGP